MLGQSFEKEEALKHHFREHHHVLVAVSGGGDSMALLHLLHTQTDLKLSVATVDHGLRVEAAGEAEMVASFAASLGLPHKTLNWKSTNKSSQSARLGRYDLLYHHCKQIGATAIALGHTLDDQAETLMMRAARAKASSGTRGMTGMTTQTTYEAVKLIRPLLGLRRQELREYLKAEGIDWIDDPSNDNPNSERVCVRKSLTRQKAPFDSASIARLASLGSRTRQWLNEKAAHVIEQQTRLNGDAIVLASPNQVPTTLLREVFSTLILVIGEQTYRSPVAKFADVVDAAVSQNAMRKAVGRCLITVTCGEVHFSKEKRRSKSIDFESGRTDPQTPALRTLEKFRLSTDDAVYFAIKDVLERGR